MFAVQLSRSCVLSLLVAGVTHAQQGPPLVPREMAPSPLVVEALSSDWLTSDERAGMRVRHGTWNEKDLENPHLRAMAAMVAHRFDDPIFQDESLPVTLRAESLLARGHATEAIAILADVEGALGASLRARAYEIGGFPEAAGREAEQAVELFLAGSDESIEEVLAVVEAMRVRARTSGTPARDYQVMLDMLGEARDKIDRLDSRIRIAEADLLLARRDPAEAIPALHEALRLNPRAAWAWYLLGRTAIDTFDFDGAAAAVITLENLGPGEPGAHSLATLLMARSAMVREDPDHARDVLDELLKAEPRMPEALALRAAADAVRYDSQGSAAWLAELDENSPGSALGYYEVGRALAFDRQYDDAADALKEAIRRRPAWPAPYIELGLLEMQTGRDGEALAALKMAEELDPFNSRAAFSLFLLEELQAFETVESEHFVLRYKPGEDEVVAEMMLPPLERMHAEVADRFQHEPDRKTVIELMPDHKFFSVRITGMPRIHTVAACTGPLIAIEVPREGPPEQHLGLFDWLKVLRHEYTHTITLSQTRNRIPHWLTEAAAVSMEEVPRKYVVAQELAERWRRGTLFDMVEINWAFVRPKRPGDRSLAYAQGHWMVEYMNERFGESALVRLLGRYFEGVRENDAMPQALGVTREEFYEGFLDWSAEQVAQWGLDPQPSLDELADRIRERDPDQLTRLKAARLRRLEKIAAMISGEAGRVAEGSRTQSDAGRWPPLRRPPVEIDDATLAELLEEHPDHPDLLELNLRRMDLADGELDPEARALLEAYAGARPVDPYPHRILARALLQSGEPREAIPHLEALDVRSEKENTFALELARLYRVERKPVQALEAAERAARMNPYDPSNRELAAAAALEAGEFAAARRHIKALVTLEPDQARHVRRLEAIERLMGRPEASGNHEG
ncbi:MAG: tetratricopeptide repeat protein [Phycisphaerales bacterium]|nr:tetratricopeptide repeat protein [Phycisphaerales bacterium]